MSAKRKASKSAGPSKHAQNTAPKSRRAATGPTSRKATGNGNGKAPANGNGNGKAPGNGNGKPRKSLPRRLLRFALLAGLGFFLLGCAAFAYGYTATDIPNPNEDFQAETTFVYYSDGEHEIGRFANQNRTSIPLSDVPEHVQDAVIAAEDQSFYTNKGIDPKGILRAAFSNARGNSTQGASTITQQYVKIFYLSSDRTITRKVKEAFVSLKLQREQSKDEILQGYLNTIYFGRGAYGIQAAAKAYFEKDAADLTVREGAALAAVLNSPGNYDPAAGADAEEALFSRYKYVLGGMADMEALPQADAEQAAQQLPKFPRIKTQDSYGGQKGHVLALVKKELLAKGFSEQEITGGGLRVTTTFTRNAMEAAEAAVQKQKPKGLKKLHVAVASIDPATGALRGMYGGQDYLKSQINWAAEGGQTGSAFKPFALAAGIEDGYSLKSTFQGNSPYVYPNGKDKVVNEGPGDGNDYGSRISLTRATEESVNTAYMDLTEAMDEGPQKILSMANRMGIPKDIPDLKPTSGISLGSAKISTIDMANAYGTIAAGGQSKEWFAISKVTSATGKNQYEAPKRLKRALPEDVDRDVSWALEQVVKKGTGQNALALGRPAAGKTGTATNDKGDVSSSWFVGYTPQLSTAVMYVRGDGNDALNGYMPSYFGADYPTRTWTEAMKQTLDDAPILEFPPPANLDAKQDDHEPLPTFTPEPSPTRTRETETEEPSPTETEEPTLTPKPSPTPKPSKTPGPPSPTCNLLDCDDGNNGGGNSTSPSPSES